MSERETRLQAQHCASRPKCRQKLLLCSPPPSALLLRTAAREKPAHSLDPPCSVPGAVPCDFQMHFCNRDFFLTVLVQKLNLVAHNEHHRVLLWVAQTNPGNCEPSGTPPELKRATTSHQKLVAEHLCTSCILAELIHDELGRSQQVQAHMTIVGEVCMIALWARKGWQEAPVTPSQWYQDVNAQGCCLLHELPVRLLWVDVVEADGVSTKVLDQGQVLRELVCHLVRCWVAIVRQGRELWGTSLALRLVGSKNLTIVAVPGIVGNTLGEEALARGIEEHVALNDNGARPSSSGSQRVVRGGRKSQERHSQNTPHCKGRSATVAQLCCGYRPE